MVSAHYNSLEARLINDGTATHISNMAEQEQHSSSSSGSEEFSLSNSSELDSELSGASEPGEQDAQELGIRPYYVLYEPQRNSESSDSDDDGSDDEHHVGRLGNNN